MAATNIKNHIGQEESHSQKSLSIGPRGQTLGLVLENSFLEEVEIESKVPFGTALKALPDRLVDGRGIPDGQTSSPLFIVLALYRMAPDPKTTATRCEQADQGLGI